MTRFRHDLILRMIKLLDAVLVTIPFAMCWYLYYAKRVASPYYAKGDYLGEYEKISVNKILL